MELTESRERASACTVDLIEYVQSGGDVRGIEERIEALDLPDENLDDAFDLILMDIYGAAAGYVKTVLPDGSSEERIQTFISVTAGILEQVAGVGRSYVEAMIDHILGRGPALPDSINDIAGYLAYCALLSPTDRGELAQLRTEVRGALEQNSMLKGTS